MNRNKKILLVAHCVLNINSKIYPLARKKGGFYKEIKKYIDEGAAIYQLPCPELSYLGMKRWGMSKEQYETTNFINHCKERIKYPLIELQNLIEDGCEIVGIIGMEKSPNCGLTQTCHGWTGGEICCKENLLPQIDNLKITKGTGVFFSIVLEELAKMGINPDFISLTE